MEGTTARRAAVKGSSCIGAIGIREIALRVISRSAIGTIAATDSRGDHNPIAPAQISDVVSNLLNDTDAFVSKYRSGFHSSQGTANEMEVGAADCAGCEPDDGIR